MGKNGEMLKTFFKIMQNDNEEIRKVIPNMYCKNFYDIDIDYLVNKGINKLIIDIDGTILPVDDIFVTIELLRCFGLYKIKHFDICLLSNNNKERVLPVAKELNVNCLYNANKPLPEAYEKALAILKAPNKESVAVIGDQMLSDIKGANEYGLYTILVDPVSNHNNIKTGTQRVLQKRIEKHLKNKGLFDKEFFNNERN